jgi:hypothetical protein
VKVTMGSSAELPCKTTGVPRPRIVWQKGTRAMTDESGNYVIKRLSYAVDTTHSLRYACSMIVVGCKIGTVVSIAIRLCNILAILLIRWQENCLHVLEKLCSAFASSY